MKVSKLAKALFSFTVLLLLAVFAAQNVYAAYVAYTNRKRTVSTWADKDLYFSSNYMESVNMSDTWESYPVIGISKGGGSTSITVMVCNYNRMNPVVYSLETIGYTFTVTVCDSNMTETDVTLDWSQFTVAAGSGAASAMTGSSKSLTGQTLAGGAMNFNSYTITFPDSFNDYIKIEAVPTNASATENRKLGAFITSSILNREKAKNWMGRLTGLDGLGAGDDVDGFNFEISGSGSSTHTLTWDTAHVDISEWNIADYGITGITSDGTERSAELDLPLLSTDTDLFHTYVLQFYRTSPQDPDEDMDDWETWITFD